MIEVHYVITKYSKKSACKKSIKSIETFKSIKSIKTFRTFLLPMLRIKQLFMLKYYQGRLILNACP